jgi:uncharacterized phiE125 gp8 family phage protein
MTWLPAEVSIAPASEPLSLADATAHVKAEEGDSEDQAYILSLTKAARAHVESYTGLKLVTQGVILRREGFSDAMPLPLAPVSAISKIEYLDPAGVTQTLPTEVWDAALYGLSPTIYRMSGQSWPSVFDSPQAVIVTATAGYATIPDEILHTMKLLVGQWYDNHSAVNVGNIVNEMPNAISALLSNHRIYAF